MGLFKPVAFFEQLDFEVVPTTLQLDYLVVAGGGGGGWSAAGAGGAGGAGGYISGSYDLSLSDSLTFNVTVGEGGNGGTTSSSPVNGSNSRFTGSNAVGGGRGGHNGSDGVIGGSGGGGSCIDSTYGNGARGTVSGGVVQGYSGSAALGSYRSYGGSGGGAGGNSTAWNSRGPGKNWLDGQNYGRGGTANGTSNGRTNYGDGGDAGGNSIYITNTGNGRNGGRGVVKVRYPGSGSKAEGGTITYDAVNDYTYHTYTSAGNSVFFWQPNGIDSDASAFISAAGITDLTQRAAINQLVVDLKLAGIWTKMKAIYPFVGGTATTHKWNLKDPQDTNAAYRLTFGGTVTHSSTGVKGNGTNGFYNTYLTQDTMPVDDVSMFVYIRDNIAEDKVDIGVLQTSAPYTGLQLNSRSSSNTITARCNSSTTLYTLANTDSRGFFGLSRLSTAEFSFSKNTTQTLQTAATNGTVSRNILGLAFNLNGAAGFFSTRQQAYSSIGNGLTDAEIDDYYNIVQKYQTLLGRAV